MSKLNKTLNTNIIKNVIEKNILMNQNNYNIINNKDFNINDINYDINNKNKYEFDNDDNNNFTIIDSINILNSSCEIDNYDDKINSTNFITSKSLVQKNINNFNKPRLILNKHNNSKNNLKNKIQNINKKIHKLEKIIIVFNNNSVLESLLFPKILF